MGCVLLCLGVTSCSDEGDQNTAPAHTHAFGEWTVTKSADCKNNGAKKQVCSCGAENIASIEKTEHIPAAPIEENKISASCTSDGRVDEVVYCSACSTEISRTTNVIPKLECSYKDGVCETCFKTAYSVTVISENKPAKDIFITVYKNGEQKGFYVTNENGVAEFTLLGDEYTFTVMSYTSNVQYDESECVLTPQKSSVTVSLYSKLTERTEIFGAVEREPMYAYYISSANQYKVNFSTNIKSYFIFTAERTGIYRISISSDVDVELGYYGGPHYVFESDITSAECRVDGSTILIDIAPANTATADRDASPYVIAIKGLSSSGSGILQVERIGEHETEPIDLPWETYGADVFPELYCPEESKLLGYTLVDFDITKTGLKIVFNENDGFYHFMTEDGPVVLLKIDIATKYLDAISTMCGPQHFGCYIFDENGNFVSKPTYHDMMLRYISASKIEEGGIGVYPLDKHLYTALTTLGNAWGWWDLSESSITHIFGDDKGLIAPESAWMFAFCYAELRPTEHKITLVSADGDPIIGATLSVTDDEGFEVARGTTGGNGEVTLSFLHTNTDYWVVLDESLLESYTVTEEDLLLSDAKLTITLTAVLPDSGDNDLYDPEAKYALYNWKNTSITVQINENSDFGDYHSLNRRFLAGDVSQIADVDTLCARRNDNMTNAINVGVTYVYVTDADSSYVLGSSSSRILASIFLNGSSAPDVFCDSVYDLVSASLNGCFFNLYSDVSDNHFSFNELAYKAQEKSFGYDEELMTTFAFSPKKKYILASDYFIDTVAALNVMPMSVSLFESCASSEIIPDSDGNGVADVSDFHAFVMQGKWDHYALMHLSALVDERIGSASGIVLDSSSRTYASALLYSSGVKIFERLRGMEKYECAIPSANSDFESFISALSELSSYKGVSVEDTDASALRERFVCDELLFGGAITLGSLSHKDYSPKAADTYIAPLPKSSTADSYTSVLDAHACLGAINKKSVHLAQVTAFLDYQSTHSSEIKEAYCLYDLIYGFLGFKKENQEALDLIRNSFSPSYNSVYDDAVCAYLSSGVPDDTGALSWVNVLLDNEFSLLSPETLWAENSKKYEKALEKLFALAAEL